MLVSIDAVIDTPNICVNSFCEAVEEPTMTGLAVVGRPLA